MPAVCLTIARDRCPSPHEIRPWVGVSWGEGSAGALGYGNTDDVGDNEVPAVVGAVDLPEPVTQLVAGVEFTCALLASGAVQCWGSGLDGRLGYGHEQNIGDDETPADVKSILPFGQ